MYISYSGVINSIGKTAITKNKTNCNIKTQNKLKYKNKQQTTITKYKTNCNNKTQNKKQTAIKKHKQTTITNFKTNCNNKIQVKLQ